MEHKTENEKKKEYLWRYRKTVRAIERIRAELEEIRDMKRGISVVNDGMPHGSGGEDLSGYAAKLDALERSLISERCRRVKCYTEITEALEGIKNENEKDVLFYRYIKGMEWWEIAEKMSYSDRWIRKLHGRALAHLTIPKEFLEVPVSM